MFNKTNFKKHLFFIMNLFILSWINKLSEVEEQEEFSPIKEGLTNFSIELENFVPSLEFAREKGYLDKNFNLTEKGLFLGNQLLTFFPNWGEVNDKVKADQFLKLVDSIDPTTFRLKLTESQWKKLDYLLS
ncbi:MAG TPA: hypothetical protein PJ990_09490 [Saprospiraceae bacterium]|mgnify:CR=1 FL=1|nr:hypothetical protein [Saprospiraceae bacterium]